MALRDKLNSLAAEAASKANTAIENGKLSLKINNEEKKIDEFTPEYRRTGPGQAGRRRDLRRRDHGPVFLHSGRPGSHCPGESRH
ncbi:MAG: hypothetical protein ACLT9P_09765 [Evtepia gabavorous]